MDAAERMDAEPPGPPVLTVRWHYEGVALRWQASAALVRFRVERAEGTGELALVNADLTARVLIDDDAATNVKYRYVVEGETSTGERFRSNEVTITRTPNLAANTSFEAGGVATQTPPSWLTWHPTASVPGVAADYTEERLGARTGRFHLTHGSAEKDWSVFTFQQFKTLPPGRYGWRVFARSDGNARLSKILVKVCAASSELATAVISVGSDHWTEYGVEVDVQANSCYEAAIQTESARNAWVHFDDVAFHRIEP